MKNMSLTFWDYMQVKEMDLVMLSTKDESVRISHHGDLPKEAKEWSQSAHRRRKSEWTTEFMVRQRSYQEISEPSFQQSKETISFLLSHY